MSQPPYPPEPADPWGRPDHGQAPGQYGPLPGASAGQPGYGWPQPGPSDAAAGTGWGQPQPTGAPGFGQPPYGPPPAGYGHPGGYGPPPAGGRKSPLPWLLGGVGALVLLVVAIVLVVSLGGGPGGSGSARDVAQAFVTSVNEQKEPDRSIFCQSYLEQGGIDADTLPVEPPEDLPDLRLTATLSEVTENGDSATAVVAFEIGTGTQLIEGNYRLDIQKENGDWKICGLDVGDVGIPGLGG
jgi:hypothetical protein